MVVLFGVLASVLIGVSDYFGRFASRRSAAVTTVITMMVTGVAVTLVLVLVVPSEYSTRDFGLGLASGAFVATALALLYAGMSRSSTAVVSPVVALGGIAVPVAVDYAVGDAPGGIAVLGFVVAIVSLLATTFSPELGDRVRPGLLLGALSGVSFGMALVLVGRTDIDSGVLAAVGQRLVGAAFLVGVAYATTQPRVLPVALRLPGMLCGAFGACGIAFYILSAQRGSLAVATVTSSMFPAVTAVLAAALDHDPLRWWQLVGIAGVLTGVGVVAAA